MYRYIIALIFMFAPFIVKSQLQLMMRNELLVYGYGGRSFLQYTIQDGNVTGHIGGGGGVAYNYYITNHLSFITGFEVGAFGSTVDVKGLSGGKHVQYTDLGRTEDMFFNSEYVRYHEEQSAVYGHIPLVLQGLLSLPQTSHHLFFSAGVKLGAAINSTYYTTYERLTTTIYLPYSNQTLTNLMPLNLLARYNSSHKFDVNDDFALKPNLAGAAELGLRLTLERGAVLYTGFYVDYSILSVQHQRDVGLIASGGDPNVFMYNSILESQHQSQSAHLSPTQPAPRISYYYADGVRLVSVGFKMKLAFNLHGFDFRRTLDCGCQTWEY